RSQSEPLRPHRFFADTAGIARRTFGQGPAELAWEDLDEAFDVAGPIIEHRFGLGAAGESEVGLDLALEHGDVVGIDELFEIDHAGVAALAELAVLVEDVGEPTRHTGAKVAPGATEHDDQTAGHVFAAVITDTFDDGFD